VELILSHPAREVNQIRVKLCEVGVGVDRVEKKGASWQVTGHTSLAKQTALLKELPGLELADPRFTCKAQERIWELAEDEDGDYEVLATR